MSQSLTRLYGHITFSTKDRYPFLKEKSIREEMHAYIGGVLKTIDSQPIIIGGVADHVHILSQMSKNQPASKIIGELKRVSSIWIKTKSPDLSRFHWQRVYQQKQCVALDSLPLKNRVTKRVWRIFNRKIKGKHSREIYQEPGRASQDKNIQRRISPFSPRIRNRI